MLENLHLRGQKIEGPETGTLTFWLSWLRQRNHQRLLSDGRNVRFLHGQFEKPRKKGDTVRPNVLKMERSKAIRTQSSGGLGLFDGHSSLLGSELRGIREQLGRLQLVHNLTSQYIRLWGGKK